MKKYIRKGSVSYEILELLSYTTEMSPKVFHHCKSHKYKVYMNEVNSMTEAHTYINEYGEVIDNLKALTIVGNGKYKTIRLREQAYDEKLLKLVNDEAYERYQVNAYHKYQNHYTKTMIERNHNLSEIYLIFRENEIRDYWLNKDEPPDNDKNGIFISGQSIKGTQLSKAVVHHGRGYGALLLNDKCHSLYYYDKISSHWSHESEVRSKGIMRKVIRDQFDNLNDKDDEFFENGIIISNRLALAYEMLTGKGMKDNTKRGCGLRLDNTYHNMRFIPILYINEMLSFLKNESLINQQLLAKTFGGIPEKSRLIDCDGVSVDGVNWLFTFDMNLPRIRRFKKNADYYEDKNFIAYGFEWQGKIMRDYFEDNDNVEIYTITYERLMEVLEISENNKVLETKGA